MNNDPRRYDDDGLYEEDIAEADENSDESSIKSKRKQRKISFEDSSESDCSDEAELAEQTQRQIALEQSVIDRIEAGAREQPVEDENEDESPEREKLKRELSRSGNDVPFDYGASINDLYFPDYLNDVLEKQICKGDFIDVIFNCPYDIHELVTEEHLSLILRELNDDHKELLFLCTVRWFSSAKIAADCRTYLKAMQTCTSLPIFRVL